MKIGIILIVIGVVFLLNNLGIINGITWGIFWPVILILVGIGMLSGKRGWGRMCCHHHNCRGFQKEKENQETENN